MRGPAAVGRRNLLVEHQLEVVRAIGDAHVYPAQRLRIGGASPPEFLKAKHAVVELQRGFEVANEHTDMHRVLGDAPRRYVTSGVPGGPAVRKVLDDLDVVAVGILDHEILVARPPLVHTIRNRDALREQIVAHRVGTIRIDGDVIELSFSCIRPIEELDPLMVVDFRKRDLDRAVGLRQREGFFETEEVEIERARLRQIADEDRHMRNAQDLWPRDEALRVRRRSEGRNASAPRIRTRRRAASCG